MEAAGKSFDGSAPPGGGIFGLKDTTETASVVLFAVPWEATTSYGRGTARGPEAIARASVQVDLFHQELGEPWRAGIALVEADDELLHRSKLASDAATIVIDAFARGEGAEQHAVALAQVNQLSHWLDDHVGGNVAAMMARGKLVGVVGGDHSVAFGSIRAHAHRFPGLGVLQFDAHADLRVAYQGFEGSHASVMHRVVSELGGVARLVSVGVRDLCIEEHLAIDGSGGRVMAFLDDQLARRRFDGEPFGSIARAIAESLPHDVYVSFDIDGLDPALCPHTGTPVPGGLSLHEARAVLRAVVGSGRRIVGFDLNEVAPGPAGDEWDANVGARVLYDLIGWALKSVPS